MMLSRQNAQVTPPVTAPRAVPDTGRVRRRRALGADWAIVVPPAVTLGVMAWGITAPSYWRDESATLSAVDRSVPRLMVMLGRTDAVHGLYYLMMWPVAHFIGTGEFDMRLPSAVAMAAAALGVAVIGRRVRSRRAGLYAGLVFAALPLVTVRGHDARPYAFVTAAAVLSTYLLLRAAEAPSGRRFGGYGLSVVLLGYLHLFGLLIAAAHALALTPAARLAASRREGARRGAGAGHEDTFMIDVDLAPTGGRQIHTLGAARRDAAAAPRGRPAGDCAVGGPRGRPAGDCAAGGPPWIPGGHGGAGRRWPARGWLMRRWLVTCAAAGAAVSPLIWLGWQQRQAIGWLREPAARDVRVLVVSLAAGTAASAVVFAALIALGAVRADWPPQRRPWSRFGPAAARAGQAERALTWIALPWLVLPPAVLLIAAEFKPVYELMYVEYCAPAVALLVGAGLAALGRPLRFAALGLVVALGLPAQLALRQPLTGGYIRSTAQFLAAREKPGDAVYYPGNGGVPAFDLTYPDGFAGLREIQLDQTPAQAGQLAGTSLPPAVVERRLNTVRRLWLVEESSAWVNPPFRLAPDFRLTLSWRRSEMWVRLYVRGPAGAPGSGGGRGDAEA